MIIKFNSIAAVKSHFQLFINADIDHLVADSFFNIRQGFSTEIEELKYINNLYNEVAASGKIIL